jgi:hypothetical protein
VPNCSSNPSAVVSLGWFITPALLIRVMRSYLFRSCAGAVRVRREGTEVEMLQDDVTVDPVDTSLALVQIAHRDHDVRSPASQCLGDLIVAPRSSIV